MPNPLTRWWQSFLYGDFPPTAPAPAAPAPAPRPIRESFSVGYDPDAGLTAAQGGSAFYRRLTQASRDPLPFTLDRARNLSHYLNATSPVAKRLIEVSVDHIIGDSVTVTSQNSHPRKRTAEQAILDTFWQVNAFDLRLRPYLIDGSLAGEICFAVGVNPVNGSVRLAPIDPAVIRSVINDRTLNPAVVVLAADAARPEQRLKVVSLDDNPYSPSFGRLMGIRTDREGLVLDTYDEDGQAKPYAGACFFWRFNSSTFATRGWPDLAPVLDFIDAHDQQVMNVIDRAALLKNFIWDVTIKNADPAAVDARRAELGTPPKPGSVLLHNDQEEWKAVNPDLGSADDQAAANIVLSHIATGGSIPKHWLGSTDDVNKASASEMNDPTLQWQRARQKVVRALLTTLATFSLDQAEMAGIIGRRDGIQPASWEISVALPELRPRDLAGIASAYAAVASALSTQVRDRTLDLKTARHVSATILDKLAGIEVTPEQIEQNLAAEQPSPPVPTNPLGLPVAAMNGR